VMFLEIIRTSHIWLTLNANPCEDNLVAIWYRLEVVRGIEMFDCLRQVKQIVMTSLPIGQLCSVITAVHRFTGISYVYVDDQSVAATIGASLASAPRESPVFFMTSREIVSGGMNYYDFP